MVGFFLLNQMAAHTKLAHPVLFDRSMVSKKTDSGWLKSYGWYARLVDLSGGVQNLKLMESMNVHQFLHLLAIRSAEIKAANPKS